MSEHDPSDEIDCPAHERRLLIDPHDDDPALASHRAGCALCADAAREALAFEATLAHTLEVPPPPDIPDRITSARRAQASRSLALVAAWVLSVGIAAWLGYGVGDREAAEPDLAQLVIQHIRAEAVTLQAEDRVPADWLAALFGKLGGDLTGDLGGVRFAGLCLIRRGEAIHLVVKGRQGPITLLFMPREHLEAAREIRGAGLQGWLVPTGYGSLAVMGKTGEAIEGLIDRALDEVRWRA